MELWDFPNDSPSLIFFLLSSSFLFLSSACFLAAQILSYAAWKQNKTSGKLHPFVCVFVCLCGCVCLCVNVLHVYLCQLREKESGGFTLAAASVSTSRAWDNWWKSSTRRVAKKREKKSDWRWQKHLFNLFWNDCFRKQFDMWYTSSDITPGTRQRDTLNKR